MRVIQTGILPTPSRNGIDMDRKLLDILVCPATRQPLSLLESAGLEALNRAIASEGGVRRQDDSVQAEALREALVTRDRKTVYRVDDGIPVLLVEDAIATAQVEGFPRA
jgi:uncharacterized protein YbaR (Trm112 family)